MSMLSSVKLACSCCSIIQILIIKGLSQTYMRYILVIITLLVVVRSNYTSCVEAVFKLEDDYADIELDMLDDNFDEVVDDVVVLAQQLPVVLQQCGREEWATVIGEFLPDDCMDAIGIAIKTIHQEQPNKALQIAEAVRVLAQVEMFCPGVEDVISDIIHKKDPQFNTTQCVKAASALTNDSSHLFEDFELRLDVPVLTDDIFRLMNGVEGYLLACDWQKAYEEYESLLPKSCRDAMYGVLYAAYKLAQKPVKNVEQILPFVEMLTKAIDECPFIN